MIVNLAGLTVKKGSHVISAEEIAEKHNKPLRRVQRCGIKNLYRFSENEKLEDVLADVSEAAIERAGFSLNEINGVYSCVGSSTSRHLMPGPARVVGENIGLKNIPMITLSMGCVGGVHALQAAYNQIVADSSEGRDGNYLVLAGDHTSRILDDGNWETAPLFSDGVAVLVVTNIKRGDYAIKKVRASSVSGQGLYSMRIKNPDTRDDGKLVFEMSGKDTFELATRQAFPEILRILELSEMPDDVYFIPHQASGLILEHMIGINNLDPDNVYTDGIRQVGNMGSASIYFSLEDVHRKNLSGDKRIIIGAYGAESQIGVVELRRNK